MLAILIRWSKCGLTSCSQLYVLVPPAGIQKGPQRGLVRPIYGTTLLFFICYVLLGVGYFRIKYCICLPLWKTISSSLWAIMYHTFMQYDLQLLCLFFKAYVMRHMIWYNAQQIKDGRIRIKHWTLKVVRHWIISLLYTAHSPSQFLYPPLWKSEDGALQLLLGNHIPTRQYSLT